MTKILSGSDGPSFGLESSEDVYEKLKHESSRLCQGWNTYDAFNFLLTAWPLFNDGKKSDPATALSRQKRDYGSVPGEMRMVLEVTRDIVNGSKHFQFDSRSASRRKVDEIHTGNEVGWYQYFFHEDLPGLTVDQHWYFSIRVLNNLLMSYFEWVFNDVIAVNDFPPELLDALQYCNIAQRRSGPSPAVWLQHIETARRRPSGG